MAARVDALFAFASSDILLVLDVPLDDVQAHGAHCADEAGSGPQRRQLGFELGELLAQHVAGVSLDLAHDVVHSVSRRVYVDEQVHVVWHDFHLYDGVAVVFLFFYDDFPEALVDAVREDFSAVFWAPDDVVLAGVDGMASVVVFLVWVGYVHAAFLLCWLYLFV